MGVPRNCTLLAIFNRAAYVAAAAIATGQTKIRIAGLKFATDKRFWFGDSSRQSAAHTPESKSITSPYGWPFQNRFLAKSNAVWP